jgi:hypothetical protein
LERRDIDKDDAGWIIGAEISPSSHDIGHHEEGEADETQGGGTGYGYGVRESLVVCV